MAFAARLGELTEELIIVITDISNQSEPEQLNVLRESSLRKLRNHSFLRTNQFNVENHLNGLEERLQVLNKEELADALRERLDALSEVSNKFTPDALHFLLELSDKPVEKSKLSDLDLLREPPDDPGPPLKWEDIGEEDGWARDRDLWKKNDFGNASSDEEYSEEVSVVSVGTETSLSSAEVPYRLQPTDYLVTSSDQAALDAVQESQSWQANAVPKDSTVKARRIVISEVQAVREVLFMLSGLPNRLYGPRGEVSTKYQLQHASWEAFRALLGTFGESGRLLRSLRDFASKTQQIPLMQAFRDTVQKRLHDFDSDLSDIQSRFVDIKQDTVVSLVKIFNDVQPQLKPLASLSEIVQQLDREKYPHPFRYLELLFDSASIAQLEGSETTYHFLGTAFFECFQIYLRPIRRWMEEGDLFEGDKTFFISDPSAKVPLAQIWHGQFRLRKTAEGTLHAPRFLQPAANKIFTTGKSVVLLKKLGRQEIQQRRPLEPALDFDTLRESDVGSFAPFSEIFDDAFERWMRSKHHAASTILSQELFETCGLWSALDALQKLYLMSDGSRSDAFAFGIFNNIDLLNPRWHDRFTLTGMAQEAFADVVDPNQLIVTVVNEKAQEKIAVARRSVRKCLPNIELTFRMAWPLRIVVSEDTIAHYQSVFTFLLQIRRATYILRKARWRFDAASELMSEQAVFYGIRTRLLWFYNALQSYLSNLVLAPLTTKLREDLKGAEDLDDMILVHSAFAKRMVNEACLGNKLDPIRQCILDVLDLALRLEDARQLEAERDEEETQELSRLSVSSPRTKFSQSGRTGRYMEASEEEDESFLSEHGNNAVTQDTDKTYREMLGEIRRDFDKSLRFICGGLRGVARASGDAASGKWDTLAEMLAPGGEEQKW